MSTKGAIKEPFLLAFAIRWVDSDLFVSIKGWTSWTFKYSCWVYQGRRAQSKFWNHPFTQTSCVYTAKQFFKKQLYSPSIFLKSLWVWRIYWIDSMKEHNFYLHNSSSDIILWSKGSVWGIYISTQLLLCSENLAEGNIRFKIQKVKV